MMVPYPKVALVGPMLSGKSTVRAILVDHGYIGCAFADRVKEDIVDAINAVEAQYQLDIPGYIPQFLTRDRIDKDKAVFRTILQWLGTEYFREYRERPNHWIDGLKTKIDFGERNGRSQFVVDDARFPNEVAALQSWGFHIVRVARDLESWEALMLERYGSKEAIAVRMSHESERHALTLPTDAVIWNMGTEADLAIETRRVLELT